MLRTELCIFMGKTDPTAARHKQQSMVIVPFRSTGIKGEQPQGRSCVSSWERRIPQPPGTSSSPWSSSPSGPPESKVRYNKGMVSVAWGITKEWSVLRIRIKVLLFTLIRIRIRILPCNLIRSGSYYSLFFQILTLQCKNDPLRLPTFHFDADPDPDLAS